MRARVVRIRRTNWREDARTKQPRRCRWVSFFSPPPGPWGSDDARRHRYLQRKADRRNRRKEKGIKSAARRTKRVRRTRKITKFASKLGVSASPEDDAPRE